MDLRSFQAKKVMASFWIYFQKLLKINKTSAKNMSVEFDHTYFTLSLSRFSLPRFILVAEVGLVWQNCCNKYIWNTQKVTQTYTRQSCLQLFFFFLQHKLFNLLPEISSLYILCHASLLPVTLFLLVDSVFVSIATQDLMTALTF